MCRMAPRIHKKRTLRKRKSVHGKRSSLHGKRSKSHKRTLHSKRNKSRKQSSKRNKTYGGGNNEYNLVKLYNTYPNVQNAFNRDARKKKREETRKFLQEYNAQKKDHMAPVRQALKNAAKHRINNNRNAANEAEEAYKYMSVFPKN